MKIISKLFIKRTASRGMFITITRRNRELSLSADLVRALRLEGKSEGFLTLALDKRGYLAMKVGKKNVDSFRVRKYGWTMKILGSAPLCSFLSDDKSRRFYVEKVGKWFVSEMHVRDAYQFLIRNGYYGRYYNS